MDKVWVIKDPNELLGSLKINALQPEPLVSEGKNPGTAYSWSVFFWGGDRFYNKQFMKGLYFFVLMAAFYTGTALTVLFWRDIVLFLQDHGMSVSVFLLVILGMLFLALIFRSLCCSNAYHGTAKNRKKSFTGTKSRVSPFICSLLLPGWGQFLNGQPIKGGIFAGFWVVSCFALVTVPVVLLTWKDLAPSSSRLLIESIFTIAVFILPVIPFVWMVSSYDALKVSRELWKKEPLWERIKATYNLRHNQLWLRWVSRQIKRFLVLVLFLAFSLIVFYKYYPSRFYSGELNSARSWMQAQGMTLLPDLLEKLSRITPPGV